MTRRDQIQKAILDAFKDESADWDAIMKSVSSQVKVRPNGWLEVRAVLNDLREKGKIYRHADLRIELYYTCKDPLDLEEN